MPTGDRGYLSITDPDRPHVERDTITCGHCQRVIFVKPGTASTVYLRLHKAAWPAAQIWEEHDGCFCTVCMRAICLECHARGRCTPWEKMLEASEARDRLRRQILGQVTG